VDVQKFETLSKKCALQESMIKNLQTELADMKANSGSESPTSEVSLLKATVSSLKKTVQEQNEKYIVLELEQEDLLLCLADQESEMDGLKERLMKYGETFEDEAY
jgi:capsule polysaccharide export protein KpsE/RkpR